jgi:hypothetical protein
MRHERVRLALRSRASRPSAPCAPESSTTWLRSPTPRNRVSECEWITYWYRATRRRTLLVLPTNPTIHFAIQNKNAPSYRPPRARCSRCRLYDDVQEPVPIERATQKTIAGWKEFGAGRRHTESRREAQRSCAVAGAQPSPSRFGFTLAGGIGCRFFLRRSRSRRAGIVRIRFSRQPQTLPHCGLFERRQHHDDPIRRRRWG